MARAASPQPTDVELRILNVLWERGACTVREVHDALGDDRETQYATTVKMLLVMLDKGLVKRDEEARPLVYRAAVSREKTQKRMLSDLLDRLYAGSAKTLMMHAVAAKKATPDELAEVRRFLDELEKSS
ncbi:MAG: BlaI/MecI/CopY family transcriptional regulator [Pirellulales bacterium]